MEKQYQLVDNESAKRFQFELDNGDVAKIEYIKAKEKIYLTHTEVPPGYEGQGIGSELIKQSLEHIKKEDWTLNISRYVLPPIGEDIPPLPEAIAALKQALSEAKEAEENRRTVLYEGGWLK